MRPSIRAYARRRESRATARRVPLDPRFREGLPDQSDRYESGASLFAQVCAFAPPSPSSGGFRTFRAVQRLHRPASFAPAPMPSRLRIAAGITICPPQETVSSDIPAFSETYAAYPIGSYFLTRFVAPRRRPSHAICPQRPLALYPRRKPLTPARLGE